MKPSSHLFVAHVATIWIPKTDIYLAIEPEDTRWLVACTRERENDRFKFSIFLPNMTVSERDEFARRLAGYLRRSPTEAPVFWCCAENLVHDKLDYIRSRFSEFPPRTFQVGDLSMLRESTRRKVLEFAAHRDRLVRLDRRALPATARIHAVA